MTLDVQTILAGLIVAVATIYCLRLGWLRLRSLGAKQSQDGGASCASGCGGCGSNVRTSRQLGISKVHSPGRGGR